MSIIFCTLAVMKLEDKIQKIENKYNLKVIELDIENNLITIENKEGYHYKIKYTGISKFRESVRCMTDYSYIKYYNNTFLNNTDYIAKDVDDNKILILNKLTNTSVWHNRYSFNKEIVDSLTTKDDNRVKFVKDKFGDKYDYSKLKFEGVKTNATLICKHHGEFNVRWGNLIYHNHQGCTQCSYITRKFGKKGFIKNCLDKEGKGYLYFIQMYNREESFFKIGISSDIEKRYRKFPYDINELLIIKGNPDSIYDLEKFLHKKYSSNLYIPKKGFNGKLECFKFDNILNIKEEILENSENLFNMLQN